MTEPWWSEGARRQARHRFIAWSVIVVALVPLLMLFVLEMVTWLLGFAQYALGSY